MTSAQEQITAAQSESSPTESSPTESSATESALIIGGGSTMDDGFLMDPTIMSIVEGLDPVTYMSEGLGVTEVIGGNFLSYLSMYKT